MVINFLKAVARLAGWLVLIIYVLFTRSWVFITALWTIVYFVMSAPQVSQFTARSMALAVPGPLTIGRIEPTINPTNLDLWDVNFSRPNHQQVIHVDHIRVKLDPIPLVLFLTGAKKRLVLSFDRIILDGFNVLLPFDKDYKFVFLETFIRPHKKSKGSGNKGPLLIFHNVIAHKGRARLHIGSWNMDIRGLDFETNFIVDIGASRVLFKMDVRNLTATGGSSVLRHCPLGPKACKQKITDMKVREFHMLGSAMRFKDFSLAIPKGVINVTGALSFPRDVGIKYMGKVSFKLDDPDYLRDLSHGLLSGPISARVGGEGTMTNPTFFAMVKSKGLVLPGLAGSKSFHGKITGFKPDTGKYHFIVRDAQMKDESSMIDLRKLVLEPFVKGVVNQADIRFKGLSSKYLIMAPKWLALPKTYSGRLRINTLKNGERRGLLSLKTNFERNGLFTPGPVEVILSSRINKNLSVLRVKSLRLKRAVDNIDFKGVVRLTNGSITGRMNMDWDISGLAGMLKQRLSGTLHSSDMRIQGRLTSPILKGSVSSSNIIVSKSNPYAIKGICKVSVHGLNCAYLRIVGNNSVFIGRGFSLDAWQKLGLKEGKGVLDLALLSQGMTGRMSLNLSKLDFLVHAPLKSLKGDLSVQSGRIRSKGMTFANIKGHVKASRGFVDVKSLTFGLGNGHVLFSGRIGRDLKSVKGMFSIHGCDLSEMKLFANSRGIIDGRLVIDMNKDLYAPSGKFSITDAGWGAAALGNVSMVISPGHNGFINLTGSAMNGALSLSTGSGIIIKHRSLSKIVLRGNMRNVDIGVFAGPNWPASLKTSISARLAMAYNPFAGSLTGQVDVPEKGLKISFTPAEEELYSSDFSLNFTKKAFYSKGLTLNDGQKSVGIDIKGSQDFKKLNVDINGYMGMYFLRYFKDTILDAKGYIKLAMHINRGLSGYTMHGSVVTGKANFLVKDFSDVIQMKPGSIINFRDNGSKTRVWVDEEQRLNAMVGDGSVSVWGTGFLRDGRLIQSQIHLDGLNLKIASQGFLWMNITPQLDLTVANGHRRISGILKITEGAFTKDYSKFMGLTYQSRSTGLLEKFPWLASTAIKLKVQGKNFKIRSKFPLGKTNIMLNMDLSLLGSLGTPRVYNRVEIVPGGTVFYNLVTRRFTVTRGVLQFNGPMKKPNIDLQAQTKVEYRRKGRQNSVVQSRFIAEALETDELRNNSQITVKLLIKGLFPDLSVALSSNARDLDQIDLEYLLLTGMTKEDIGSGSGSLNVGMLTEGISGVLTKALMTPILDVASIGIQPNGGFTADLSFKFGHNLSLMTSVEQSSTFSRYSAGFRFRLTEHLSLEGFVRSVEISPDPSEVGRRYESKLRYRIPLE